MRITRETLLKIARDTAAQRVRTSRRIVCIYLTGSVLADEPLIGGTADIDLVCVHDSEPPMRREVVRLVDEVHLDIGHYPQSDFGQPRHLRQDPWLGPYITSHPLLLHDMAHWFDFAQAAITAQFNTPENVLARAHAFSDTARQTWLNLRLSGEVTPEQVWGYLRALENSGNAIAALSGAPLTERRFWLGLPARAEAVGRPGLATGLLDLLLPEALPAGDWQSWQPHWQNAMAAATQSPLCPARLHPARLPYYLRSAAALFEPSPAAAAWLALRTWTQAAALFPADSAGLAPWRSVLASLGLDAAGFSARLDAFDAYLDSLEETLDTWGKENGI